MTDADIDKLMAEARKEVEAEEAAAPPADQEEPELEIVDYRDSLWQRIWDWLTPSCSCSIPWPGSYSALNGDDAAFFRDSKAVMAKHKENLVRVGTNLGKTRRELVEIEKDYKLAREEFNIAVKGKKHNKVDLQMLAETMLHWKILRDKKQVTVRTLAQMQIHLKLMISSRVDRERQHNLVNDLDKITDMIADDTDYAEELRSDMQGLKTSLEPETSEDKSEEMESTIQQAMRVLSAEHTDEPVEAENEAGSSPRGGQEHIAVWGLPDVPTTRLLQPPTTTQRRPTGPAPAAVLDLL